MKPILERKLLNESSYIALFENIETLYNVNGELMKELKQNPENVAHAFCKLAPFFKLYSVYAYNYKRALDLLQVRNHQIKKILWFFCYILFQMPIALIRFRKFTMHFLRTGNTAKQSSSCRIYIESRNEARSKQ